jgi:hypothetical protein
VHRVPAAGRSSASSSKAATHQLRPDKIGARTAPSPCWRHFVARQISVATDQLAVLVARELCLMLSALVQLNHIAIGIAHEDPLRPRTEADGPATERDASRLEPLLRNHDVRAQEREVRDSRVLLCTIHEDVRLVRVRSVEYEVYFHPDGCSRIATGSGPIGPSVFVKPSSSYKRTERSRSCTRTPLWARPKIGIAGVFTFSMFILLPVATTAVDAGRDLPLLSPASCGHVPNWRSR